MSTETPEAKELGLVSKVELRIAMVSSDDKLQSILNTYLPPLLLKLASEFVSVRNKVCNSSVKMTQFSRRRASVYEAVGAKRCECYFSCGCD